MQDLADKAAAGRLDTFRADQEHVLAEIAARYEHLLMMQPPAVAIKVASECQLCGSELLGRRSDALYCTNVCRQRGYRQRLAHRALAAA
jgi:hypothetical protein